MIQREVAMKQIMVWVLGLIIFGVGFTIAPTQSAITGVVSGKVVDNNGEPIAGVRVSLVSVEGRNPNKEVISNKNGVFRFVSINPGDYLIAAEREGYKHRGGSNFRVSANSSISFDVFMDPVQQADCTENESSDT